MAISNLPLTAKQREQLIALGFEESQINNQTLIDVTLWKQALNGNVTALNTIKGMLEEQNSNEEDSTKDISQEVEEEEKKLGELLSGLTEVQKKINKELIHNIAFQGVTLRHLANDIAKNGVKEKYKNGANQWGWKDRSEVKTYNNMIKSYQSCMKQINEILVNSNLGGADDDFDNF